jgi:hypothetical protein
MEDRRSYAFPVIASGLSLALMLGAYVSGYFLCGVLHSDGHGNCSREYPFRWQAFIYKPAAWAESAYIERNVFVFATADVPPQPVSPLPQFPYPPLENP